MFAPDNISTPIAFNADVSDEVALVEGDEAADRIISGSTMIDQLKIGRALKVGARLAAIKAGRDYGKHYNIAFSQWLQEHPKLAAVNEQNRAAALWCLSDGIWPKVEAYLATLGAERQTITLRTVRRRLDHAAAKDPIGAKDPDAPKKETKAEALVRENEELWAKVKKLERQVSSTDDGPYNIHTDSIDDIVDHWARTVSLGRFTSLQRSITAKLAALKKGQRAKSSKADDILTPAGRKMLGGLLK